MGKRDESDRTKFSLERNHRTIEHRPGCAHPGTEQGAMSGSLMLGMVTCMFDRLCLSQSADGQDAEHQKDRHKFSNCVPQHEETPAESGKS